MNNPQKIPGEQFDHAPVEQRSAYPTLTQQEIERGFVRPLRDTYIHATRRGGCGAQTVIRNKKIVESLAANPKFYKGGYCVGCKMHRPNEEFEWLDGTEVGT